MTGEKVELAFDMLARRLYDIEQRATTRRSSSRSPPPGMGDADADADPAHGTLVPPDAHEDIDGARRLPRASSTHGPPPARIYRSDGAHASVELKAAPPPETHAACC